MSKEYIFTVEVNGEDVIWKCVVDEKEVITYEGDTECERLAITNTERALGVLQLETEVKVYDDKLLFHLENGIPSILLEGEWTLSDTTTEERLQKQIKKMKTEIYIVFGLGIVAVIYTLVKLVVTGHAGDLIPFAGVICIMMSMIQLYNLKRELNALGRTFSWKL